MRSIVVSAACVLAIGCSSDAGDDPAPFDNGPQAPSGINGPPAAPPPAGAAALAYPVGPYGSDLGSIAENFSFLGWNAPLDRDYATGDLEEVTLARLYDPDGQTMMTTPAGNQVPVQLTLVMISATWCNPCREEQRWLRDNGKYAEYAEKGVQFLGLILEDINAGPAQPKDIASWGKTFDIEYPLALDPAKKSGVWFTGDAIPLNMIVRARDMQITWKILGSDPEGMLDEADSQLADL
jgi:hypothetical protein